MLIQNYIFATFLKFNYTYKNKESLIWKRLVILLLRKIVSDYQAVIIPKRAFETPEKAQEFYVFIDEKVKASKS